MKILVINCGSSSLKYQLFDMESENGSLKVFVKLLAQAQALQRAQLLMAENLKCRM